MRYSTSLLVVSATLIIASLAVLLWAPHAFSIAMPLLVVYFAVLTAIQHAIVTRSMEKSPKTFVQIFLGTTIGAIFIHLLLIVIFMFSAPTMIKSFLIAFCVGFIVYLAFETIALVRHIDKERKNRQNQPPAVQ